MIIIMSNLRGGGGGVILSGAELLKMILGRDKIEICQQQGMVLGHGCV